MTDRAYSTITSLCMLMAVASAIAFEHTGGALRLIVTGAGACSALVSISCYFYNLWKEKPSAERLSRPLPVAVASNSLLPLAVAPAVVRSDEQWEELTRFCEMATSLNVHYDRQAKIQFVREGGITERSATVQTYLGSSNESDFQHNLQQLITRIIVAEHLSVAEIAITRKGLLRVEWPRELDMGTPVLSPVTIRIARPVSAVVVTGKPTALVQASREKAN